MNETAISTADDAATHARQLDADASSKRKAQVAKAECERRGGVAIGMTAAQVKASCWGNPKSVNTTTTAGGKREQWVYGLKSYVYLTNGFVTAIQN